MCQEGDRHWIDYYDELLAKTRHPESMTDKEKKDLKLLKIAKHNEKIIMSKAYLEWMENK